jgi:signal transduction histidine kinase
MKTDIAPFEMSKSIETVVRIVTPFAEKKGRDRRRVEQILFNLLYNAIKFTEKGEVITRIIDTGIGIKSEHIDRIFKPFLQLDDRLSRRYEGTGLGLSICKRLVEMLDGMINVICEFGKGSVFTFTLPLKREIT